MNEIETKLSELQEILRQFYRAMVHVCIHGGQDRHWYVECRHYVDDRVFISSSGKSLAEALDRAREQLLERARTALKVGAPVSESKD